MKPTSLTQEFRAILHEHLEMRCQRNPRYSLRAFARDLGMSAPRVSGVLQGKFGLSRKAAEEISSKLGFSEAERVRFCDLVESAHARSTVDREIAAARLKRLQARYTSLPLDGFKVISDWYHFAILELTLVQGFRGTPAWIARELGVSYHEAEGAIERLIRLGLLEKKEQTLRLTGSYFSGDTATPSDAIRKFHTQMLEKAKDALIFQELEVRDFSNITVAIDKKDLPRAKEMIRKFRSEFDRELSKGKNKSEVYSLSIQFFSLKDSQT